MAPSRRQVAAATADGLCCCPQGMPWTVRIGLSRTYLVTVLLGLIWLLNAGDLLLTCVALTSHGAWEANAVMRHLFEQGTLAGAAFKIAIVSLGVVALWFLRRRSVVLYTTAALSVVFVTLVTYEVLWILS